MNFVALNLRLFFQKCKNLLYGYRLISFYF